MKKNLLLPIFSVVSGIIAFAMRLFQNHTGFEAATGLPIPGHLSGRLLVIWFAVSAAILLLLSRMTPRDAKNPPLFPIGFNTDHKNLLFLPVAGSLLLALSGLADLFEGLTQTNLLTRIQMAADPYAAVDAVSPRFDARAQTVLGCLTLICAAALFLGTLSCRKNEEGAIPFNGNLLLIPPVTLVIRLVLVYRLDSVNPSLTVYYVELLALVFLTLAFYRLSSFAFLAGRTPRFALYTGLALIFSLAALADDCLLSSLLLYAGGTATLLGFLLLRLLSSQENPST